MDGAMAALVSKPRINLIVSFHGITAFHCSLRMGNFNSRYHGGVNF